MDMEQSSAKTEEGKIHSTTFILTADLGVTNAL